MRTSDYTLDTNDKEVVRASNNGTNIKSFLISNNSTTTAYTVTVKIGTQSSKTTVFILDIPAKVSVNLIDMTNDLFIPHKKSIFATVSTGTDVDSVITYEHI